MTRYHEVPAWALYRRVSEGDTRYVQTVYTAEIASQLVESGRADLSSYEPQTRVCGLDRTDESPEDRACYQCSTGNPTIDVER